MTLKGIKVPKTWYLTSDTINDFLQYNNLEEVHEQKYKDLNDVRQEYPHIVQIFKYCEYFIPVFTVREFIYPLPFLFIIRVDSHL